MKTNQILFKNRETFKKEIEEYMRVYGTSMLEAISAYQEKYGLDESYIANKLLDKQLKEDLEMECQINRMLTK